MTPSDFTPSFELALQTAQHRFPRLSMIRSKANPDDRLHLAAPSITAPSFYLLDVTMVGGKPRLIEANGSNGALSSTVAAGDHLRARHMAFAFESKVRPAGPVSVLLCHQEGFLHLPEFFGRAELFKDELSLCHDAAVRGCDEDPGTEAITIVCGSTADVAAMTARRGSELFYKGRPVVFASNPNLVPELARQGVISRIGDAYDIDLGFFHEGDGTLLIHNKAGQQDVAAGTGIVPLACRLAHSREGWMDAVEWFRSRNLACVGKLHSASGGTGIEMVRPDMTDAECDKVHDRILAAGAEKYGVAVAQTAYPIALFEFADSDPVVLAGAQHRWDLRVMALVYPGGVDTYPCVGRLCPAPINASWSRDTWVSNLSGRDGAAAMKFLRTPSELGLGQEAIQRILGSCAEWSVAAAQWRPEGGLVS